MIAARRSAGLGQLEPPAPYFQTFPHLDRPQYSLVETSVDTLFILGSGLPSSDISQGTDGQREV